MLSIRGLSVNYGHVEALRGIDLEAREGEVTAIIGSNGAGKTSTLMAISGLAPITGGSIFLAGRQISGMAPHFIARLGIAHVLEGRQIFADQTVEDNLLLGGYTKLPGQRARVKELVERELDRFPALRTRRTQRKTIFDVNCAACHASDRTGTSLPIAEIGTDRGQIGRAHV